MKISEKITKFQEGGAVPAADPAAAQGGAPAGAEGQEQDPMAQLLQIAQQAIEGQDAEAAFAVCDGLLQLAAQSQSQAAPAGAEGSQPVYKRGGKLVKRI